MIEETSDELTQRLSQEINDKLSMGDKNVGKTGDDDLRMSDDEVQSGYDILKLCSQTQKETQCQGEDDEDSMEFEIPNSQGEEKPERRNSNELAERMKKKKRNLLKRKKKNGRNRKKKKKKEVITIE